MKIQATSILVVAMLFTVGIRSAAAQVAPIAVTSRTPASILAEWRELERRAQGAPEGSPERTEIEILASRLREEYRSAFDAAKGKDQ